MTPRCVLLAILGLTGPCAAQLRPKRVGVSPMGEETAMGGDAAVGEQPEGMEALLKAMGGGGGQMDMGALAQNLKDNPLLQGAFEGNAEMANLLNDPEELAKKVAEMQQMMNSDEGKEASAKIMEEVQSVLQDPEKMRLGLEQFASNPMLKGVAEAMPELQEVLSNPALMEESIAQAQKMFSGMGGGLDAAKMQEMMGMMQQPDALKEVLSNPELLQEGMKKMQAMFGGGDGGANLADLMGSLGGKPGGLEGLMGAGAGDSDLKQRVRAQMAGMMRDREGEEEEF